MTRIKKMFNKYFKKGKQAKRHFLIHAYLYKKGVMFDDVVLHTEVDVYPNKATITTNIAIKYSEFGIDRVKVDVPVEVTKAEAVEWVTVPEWYSDVLKKEAEKQQQTRTQKRKYTRNKRHKRSTKTTQS